jgi:O-antigen/teichoic acid export membrane protein
VLAEVNEEPSAQEPPIRSLTKRARPTFSAAATYGASAAVSAIALANVLITSRSLGPEGRGEVVFLTTVAALTSYASLFGVQEANANLAAREPLTRPSLATNSLIFAAFLGIGGGGVVYVLMQLFPALSADASTPLVWAALASIPFLTVQQYLLALLRADYRFTFANVASILVPAVTLAVNALFAALGIITAATAVGAAVAAQVLGSIALVGYTSRRLAGFGLPSVPLARRSFTFGTKAHLGGIMATGNLRLDHWFVGVIAGQRELGLYNAAVAWSEALFLLPQALGLVFRPDLVRASEHAARRQAAAVFRVGVLLTVPLALAIFLAAPFLCVTVLGGAFEGSIVDLRLLVPGAFGIVALKVLGSALLARGRPLREASATAVAFAATILLDILLIPRFGGAGAAMASTVSYCVGGLAIALLFCRAVGCPPASLVPRPADLRAIWKGLRAARG